MTARDAVDSVGLVPRITGVPAARPAVKILKICESFLWERDDEPLPRPAGRPPSAVVAKELRPLVACIDSIERFRQVKNSALARVMEAAIVGVLKAFENRLPDAQRRLVQQRPRGRSASGSSRLVGAAARNHAARNLASSGAAVFARTLYPPQLRPHRDLKRTRDLFRACTL